MADADGGNAGNGNVGGENGAKAHEFLSPGYQEPLFGCFGDPTGCALACCCPCIVAGSTKALLDERPCSVLDALCMAGAYQNRQSLRAKYKLGFYPLKDCLTACCCGACMLHQEARELAKRSGREVVWVGPADQQMN